MARGFSHESQRNESIEWYTPPSIFERIGLRYDLDPCSPGEGKSFVPADKFYTIEDDGLTSPWEGKVWMNPPYNSEIVPWMNKFKEHHNGIALVFSRTDTQWFQNVAATSDLICFISKRVKFYKGGMDHQPGTPGAGSCLIANGKESMDAVLASGLGLCVEPRVIASAAPETPIVVL